MTKKNEGDLPPEVIDLGHVGEVTAIKAGVVRMLDADKYIPVIAPIGVGVDGTTYNINADLVAGKIASELKAEKLILLTNTPGVLDKEGKLLTGLGKEEIDDLKADGTIAGGMLPKIQCALDAVNDGVNTSVISDGRIAHAVLLELLTNRGSGTLIS